MSYSPKAGARRRVGRVLAGLSLGVLLAGTAMVSAAADFPDKPVRLMVGMAPGGSNDTVARMVAAELSKRWPQPVIVENKPGANSTIATGELKRATPDGYTLMLVISSHVTNTLLYPNLSYTLRDFAPVSLIADTPFVLVANPKFGPDNVHDLIALAKTQQKGIDFGTPGQGSTQHISLELLDQMAGIRMNHIPYKGGAPAQTDVIGGLIPLIFATPTQSLPFIKDHKLKALGVTSAQRLPQLPNVPTLAESGVPGYEANVWFGIIAPAGTPPQTIAFLHREISRVLQEPGVRQRLTELGLTPLDESPVQFQQLIDTEKTKWTKVIQDANIKFE
ncbi:MULTISPECIES: tripartite tricarboxylate transporter substrate binding protein [unclassified Achromobacter]|uniref:Bug family tripartite tricarboxylate transporter substrate binding protein n=1 Tax=unclassified Achromobacter TaxID=2626865 RepID=UPI000B515A99|nr:MULTISPECIES: tripartite tricarboxylate transporter substrate binding protein [unclassified Achromobacter]OWT73543.1 ABC transporter substrate-binding protein [Achromobacter sp. HZ34]OWT79539.1 ABC transporter substrate-binding protein [Achromobacter sp. HZ28]